MKRMLLFLTILIFSFTPAVLAQSATQTTTTTQPGVVAPTTTTQTLPLTLPEYSDPWQVSIQGGGLWSQKDKSRLHDGEAIFGRLTYDVTPNLAIGAESGGLRFKDETSGTTYGHLNGVPALADLVLKMPIAATGNHLVPYVFGSAGVIFWSYDKSGYSDTTGVKARSRTHFAAKPGAGLEYYLTPRIAIFVEGSYLFSEKFRLRNAAVTPPNGNIDVNSIYGGGGIKIAF